MVWRHKPNLWQLLAGVGETSGTVEKHAAEVELTSRRNQTIQQVILMMPRVMTVLKTACDPIPFATLHFMLYMFLNLLDPIQLVFLPAALLILL